MRRARSVVVLLLAIAIPLQAQSGRIYTYVGRITADSFLLAWGTADGEGNTIGRSSVSLGSAVVEVDGRRLPAGSKNFMRVSSFGFFHVTSTAFPF